MANLEGLATTLQSLLGASELRHAMGVAGMDAVAGSRGAVVRSLQRIEAILAADQ